MNIRWLWLDFIEAPFALTREQKREVRRLASRLAMRREWNATALPGPQSNQRRQHYAPGAMWTALSVIVIVLLVNAVLVIVVRLLGLQGFLSLLVLLLATWIVVSWMAYRSRQPWYRLAMHQLKHPICAACGYDLTGIGDDPQGARRCPECGWMRPRPDDPPSTEWSEADRAALREIGYAACDRCGGLIGPGEQTCPRCGEASKQSGMKGHRD